MAANVAPAGESSLGRSLACLACGSLLTTRKQAADGSRFPLKWKQFILTREGERGKERKRERKRVAKANSHNDNMATQS